MQTLDNPSPVEQAIAGGYISTVPKKMVQVEAVVTRCGCTEEQKQADDWHGKLDVVCPNPREVEDLGVISYWHRNPLRRWAWKLSRLFR